MSMKESRFATASTEHKPAVSAERIRGKRKKKTLKLTGAHRMRTAERQQAHSQVDSTQYLEPQKHVKETAQPPVQPLNKAPMLSGAAPPFSPCAKPGLQGTEKKEPNLLSIATVLKPTVSSASESLIRKTSKLSATAQAFVPSATVSIKEECRPVGPQATQLADDIQYAEDARGKPFPTMQWAPEPAMRHTPTHMFQPWQSEAPTALPPAYVPQRFINMEYPVQPIPFPMQFQPAPLMYCPPFRHDETFATRPGLPYGWVRRLVYEQDKYIYFNIHTMESRWEEPNEAAVRPANKPSSEKITRFNGDQGSSSSNGVSNSVPTLNPANMYQAIKSTAPSADIVVACTDVALKIDALKARCKAIPSDTCFIPNPMTTFLIDGVDHLICQLCRQSTMKVSEPSCKISDNQPAILPCGHVFGAKCVHFLISTGRVHCPSCRFSLRHAKCGHVRMPQVLDQESILAVPKTIPAGGGFAEHCKDCRLEGEETKAVVGGCELKEKFVLARDAFEQNATKENEESMKHITSSLENMAFESRSRILGHTVLLW